MKDSDFLNQSACLYAAYYTVQIVVHRPFIPSPRKPSPLSFPSLAICTNAARSCIHVLDEAWSRTHTTSHMHQVSLGSAHYPVCYLFCFYLAGWGLTDWWVWDSNMRC